MNTKAMGIFSVIVILAGIFSFLGGVTLGEIQGYNIGVNDGTQQTLNGVTDMLQQQGIDIAWTHNADGSYTVEYLSNDGATKITTSISLHAFVDQYRDGKLLASSYHAMSVTNIGKDWVEQQLFEANATQKALYISTSADDTAFNAAWTAIPAEVTSNGLARATGVYSSTGVGTANVTATFTVTGTQSTQLYGLSYDTYVSGPDSLIAAEQQGAGAVKNFLDGDTLVLTIEWTHA